MGGAATVRDPRLELASRSSRMPGTNLIFVAAVLLMLGTWALLALMYSGIGGQNVADSRQAISSLTSSRATSGNVEVQGILATPEYFAIAGRADEFFRLAPETNLRAMTTTPDAFAILDQSPASLAIQPDRVLPVLLILQVHEGAVPAPEQWVPEVSLRLDGVPVSRAQSYRVAFRSEHHQTVALQFARQDARGREILSGEPGLLAISLPSLEPDGSELTALWSLPIANHGSGAAGGTFLSAAATLGSMMAVMAGLLVVFSPCVVHMTAYFLPIITGLGMREILDRKDDRCFRTHVALSGVAFVTGFVLLYTVFGVAAGLAGQFFANTEQLKPALLPFRVVTGGVVIYLALQTLGLFRLPFVVSLRLPGRPHNARLRRQGYFAAALAGMSVSMGCLVCVGGTLLASLLVYAGVSASPLVGGATLLLFSFGMSIPFLLVAFAFDRVLPRFDRARSLLRYSSAVAGALMLVMGLLILSGNDSVVERLVV